MPNDREPRLDAARPPPRRHPACRRRHTRWPLHQHEPRRLQVLYQSARRNPRHHVVRMAHPLSPLVAEREGQGVGDLVRGGGPIRSIGPSPKNRLRTRTCGECLECPLMATVSRVHLAVGASVESTVRSGDTKALGLGFGDCRWRWMQDQTLLVGVNAGFWIDRQC